MTSDSQQPCLYTHCCAMLHGRHRQQEKADATSACSCLTVPAQKMTRHNWQSTSTAGWQRQSDRCKAELAAGWSPCPQKSTGSLPATEIEMLQRLPSGLPDQAAAMQQDSQAGLCEGSLVAQLLEHHVVAGESAHEHPTRLPAPAPALPLAGQSRCGTPAAAGGLWG